MCADYQFLLKMMLFPMVDANVFSRVRGSLDFSTPKIIVGIGKPSQRIIFQKKIYVLNCHKIKVQPTALKGGYIQSLKAVDQEYVAGAIVELSHERWSDVFQSPPHYFHGVPYTGLVMSPFTTTNRVCTTLDAISSKKERSQLHKTKDLDNDGNLLAEEDLKSKPLGFGHGKTYDISLEEKLLEQIEHEKAAQAAALSRQRTNAASKKPVAKSNLEHSTTMGGTKVWVSDLPKKRNIDRDLRSAFRHIPGLLDISPSVHGNEKTRDPICKGFGFLTFDTLDHAKSFISSFQGQPISFGKVEKQLSFNITKASGAEAISSVSKSSIEVSKLRVRERDAGRVAGSSTRPRIVEQGMSVDAMQKREATQLSQPLGEVIQNEEEIASFQEYDESPGEEESDDDYDFDDESEIEVSVEMGDPSMDSAIFIDRPQVVEDKTLSEAERRIEELEERLRKKLLEGSESEKKNEKQMTKPKGFNARKSGAPRQSSPKGNNLATVTHGLRRREREVMTGVLEKYGRGPSRTKP